MTVHDHALLAITEDAVTPQDFFFLTKGLHKVDIEYESGAAGTIALFQGLSPSQTNFDAVDDGDASNPYSTTETDGTVVTGPCYLTFTATGVSGTIKLRATRTCH